MNTCSIRRGAYRSPLSYVLLSVVLLSCNGLQKANEAEDSRNSTFSSGSDSSDEPAYSTPLYTWDPDYRGVVRKIFQDRSGQLWFGTQEGAYRYDGEHFILYENIMNEYGQGVTIHDIAQDRDGTMWFAHTGGLSSYDGMEVTNYHEKEGLIHHDVWCIAADPSGGMWIGTLQGACYFDGKSFSPFAIPSAEKDSTRGVSSPDIVHSILCDSQGRIWFGHNGGAYLYDGENLSLLTEEDGLCNTNVDEVIEDRQGRFWLATAHDGICIFNGESFNPFNESHGLKTADNWTIYEDRSDRIWMAAKHLGLYSYDGKSLNHYSAADGLESPVIMSILEDDQGRLWCGGVGGLFRLDGERFIPVLIRTS